MNAQRRSIDRNSTSVKRRIAYSLAAGAASVTGAQQAEAVIQYTDFEPDISLTLGYGFQSLNLDPDQYYDVTLKNYIFGGGNYQGLTIDFAPGRVVGFINDDIHYISALGLGDVVDETTVHPTSFYGALAYGVNNPLAEFNDVTAYIGFSFPYVDNDPLPHYAWMRVTINNAAGTFIVHDYAYEDVPGLGITIAEFSPGGLEGDYNGNNIIDAADYTVWRDTLTAGGTELLNDPTPGVVDETDFTYWRDNFGTALGGGAGSAASTAVTATIPEPATLGLLAAGSLGVLVLRRLRGRDS